MIKVSLLISILTATSLMAGTDFGELYKKAIKPEHKKTILLTDDFENGINPKTAAILNCKDSSEVAGLSITSDTKSTGSKALTLKNSESVEQGFMPSLNQWFQNGEVLKSGTLKLHFDFLIPKAGNAIVVIESRDYSGEYPIQHFRATLTHAGFRLGETSKAYTVDQWLHCELSIPVNQADKKIIMQITEKNGSVHKTSIEQQITSISWLGLILSQKNNSHFYIDNLVISTINTTAQTDF